MPASNFKPLCERHRTTPERAGGASPILPAQEPDDLFDKGTLGKQWIRDEIEKAEK